MTERRFRKLAMPCLAALTLLGGAPAFAEPVVQAETAGETAVTSNSDIELTNRQISLMRNSLCMSLIHRLDNEKNGVTIAGNIEMSILRDTNIDPNSDDLKLEISRVWSKYSHLMICPSTGGIHPKQHVFKRAIAVDAHQDALAGYFFADADGFPIDPNVVEIGADGEPYNLVDYINAMLARPDAPKRYNVGEIVRLRRLLQTRFGAKPVSEMTPEELASYMSKLTTSP